MRGTDDGPRRYDRISGPLTTRCELCPVSFDHIRIHIREGLVQHLRRTIETGEQVGKRLGLRVKGKRLDLLPARLASLPQLILGQAFGLLDFGFHARDRGGHTAPANSGISIVV